MTPVEQALAELLTTATEAKDFVTSEAPEVAQQLLTYHFYTSLTAFVVSAAITAVVTAPVVWFTRRHLERQEKHSSAKSPHL